MSNSITHDRHAAPIKGCFCGIYGATELEQVRQYVVASHSGYAGVGHYAHRVVGHVNLWGRVVECSQGYRASRAYPARLWLPTRRPDGKRFDVERVALGLLDYGVPTELLDAGTRYEIMNQLGYARRAAA
ncbi:MAG: hypothetical protein M3322_12685 [Actinomycetota bacterium]|nr:hypothetical protein [Actinomycetota bacterium]